MVTVLVLYRFHDVVVEDFVRDVVIPVCSPEAKVVTIEKASDDPSHPLYWLKVYHILRFSADIVISVKRDGESRSESISVEQDFIARTSLRGHPFAIHASKQGLADQLTAAHYCAPYDISFRITDKYFRTPNSRSKNGITGKFITDRKTGKSLVLHEFRGFMQESFMKRSQHIQDFQRTCPKLFHYWQHASASIGNSEKLSSVVHRRDGNNFEYFLPKQSFSTDRFDEVFEDLLENPNANRLYVLAARMKEFIGKAQSEPHKIWFPSKTRRFIEDCVPKRDLKVFSYYVLFLTLTTSIMYLVTLPLRIGLKLFSRL